MLLNIFSSFVLVQLDFIASVAGVLFIIFYKPSIEAFKEIISFMIFQMGILFLIMLTNYAIATVNNILLYQINAIGSLFFLEIFFLKGLQVFSKKILIIIFIIILIILSLYAIFIESRSELNSYSYGFVSLVITFLSFSFYFKMLKNPDTIPIDKTPNFWFVTGLLLYYSLSMFILLPYKILTQLKITFTHDNFLDLWLLQSFIYSIMIIFFIKGFTCTKYLKNH
jgi:hypothetical protein